MIRRSEESAWEVDAIPNAQQEPQTARLRRIDAVLVVILAALSLLSWYPRRHGALDLRWDGSVYYVLGTSVAEGTGYRLLNEPGDIRANQYPPLLPWIIAVHQKILGTSDPFVVGPWLKLSYMCLGMFVIAGTYLVSRRFLPPVWAGCAGLAYVLNLPAYLHFSMMAAELPFAAALVALLLVYRGKWTAGREAVASCAVIAAFLLRTIGIVLIAAWVAEAILRRNFRRAALRAAVSMACVIPWYAYVYYVEASSEYKHPAYAYQRADYLYYNVSYARNVSYIDPYRPELGRAAYQDLARRVFDNWIALPGVIGETVTSYRSFWIGQSAWLNSRTGMRIVPPAVITVVLMIFGCIALSGMALLAGRGEWLIAIYVLLTFAAVSATPWPLQHVRYLSPSLPVLLPGLFFALHALYRASPRSVPAIHATVRAAVICLISTMVLQQAATYYQAHTKYLIGSGVTDRSGRPVVYRQLFYYAENVAMDECITWLEQHARPRDIAGASMAHWVYLRTGLTAVMPPLEVNGVAASALLASVPVRYLIQETPSFYASRYVSNAVQATPANWRLVYTAKAADVRVYERVP